MTEAEVAAQATQATQKPLHLYAAVYLTEGREWASIGTAELTREAALAEHERYAKKCPLWCRDNVFQRVGKFAMIEVPEGEQ